MNNHSEGHDHAHAPDNFGKAFLFAIVLNGAFVLIEVFCGLVSNSTALLSDAIHNFGDVLGILIAWLAYKLSARVPDHKFTYGFKASTILATVINGIFLLMATGIILWEAIIRIFSPSPVQGITVVIVAAFGIVINSVSAYLLAKGGKDLNIKAAFLHLASDALVSLGAVIAGIVIILTGFSYVDPIVSIIIGITIIYSTWGLLKEGIKLSLQAVPRNINLAEVKEFLLSQDNVKEVHDLHIWAIGTTETALTAHLVLKDESVKININEICHELLHEFEISHSTLQVESMADNQES